MAQQFHLQHGILLRHRLHRKALGPHDPPSRRTRAQRGLGGAVESGLAAGLFDAPLENHLAAVLLDLLLQFRHHQVDGGVHVGRRVLSTQHDAVPPHRDLNHLRLAQPAAALHAQHHLGILYLVEVPRDLADLCLGVTAQGWSDIHVLALYDDVKRSELPGSRHEHTSPLEVRQLIEVLPACLVPWSQGDQAWGMKSDSARRMA